MTADYTPARTLRYQQTDDDIAAQAALEALASLPEEEARKRIAEAFEREHEGEE